MPNFIHDSGPLTAQTLIVGEAGGKDENTRRRPFVGRAGNRLNEFLRYAKVDRMRELRITNTYPFQPPGNVLDAVPLEERLKWLAVLHDTIRKMDRLRLVIPMGAYALDALLPARPKKHTITKVRGSVYHLPERPDVLVLPMVHPMLTLYEDRWTRGAVKDWHRARLLMDQPGAFAPVQRTHEIMPSLQRLREFKRECVALGKQDVLAMDIETPKKITRKLMGHFKNGKPKWKKIEGRRFIACMGASYHPQHSLTWPLTRAYWGRDLEAAWLETEEICATSVPKAFHNGMFDTWHLARVRCPVRNWWWDTKDMHHALDAWEQHSLAYCASTDSWEPYWKDESGNDAGLPTDEFLEQYWRYNGKDACVTRELVPVYMQRLKEMAS